MSSVPSDVLRIIEDLPDSSPRSSIPDDVLEILNKI